MATQIVRNKTTKSYSKKTVNKVVKKIAKQKHPTTDCCVHKVHLK